MTASSPLILSGVQIGTLNGCFSLHVPGGIQKVLPDRRKGVRTISMASVSKPSAPRIRSERYSVESTNSTK